MTRFQCIVVGLGAMGSCALAELARRGVRVLGIDRFAPPHDRGSSHGGSRVIRLSYFEHPDYVPLLRRAYELFDRMSRDAGEALRHETGLVVGGPVGNGASAGMLRSAREHGLAVEALDGAELTRRFPMFRVPADWECVFEAPGGFVRPERTIAAALADAARHGAEMRVDAPIERWGADARGAWVECAGTRFEAESLVLAAGAWMPALLAGRAATLRPTRETIVWLDDRGDERFRRPNMPVWLFDRGALPAVYGIPRFDGMGAPSGMKIGLHGDGPDATPESIAREVDAAAVARATSAANERLAVDAPLEVVAARHCLYTMSPDTDFVLGLHPEHPACRVAIACGFSGHGFKFAPVIGEALADLAMHGSTRLPIGFLSPQRFAKSV
ncbi:MAG: N-methyl-L-tryptophan oxidase [Phycisphaerales bacterium]